ncbi:PqqD family peptide modification chaperone [Sphingomonas arenae]|uniref:PqqD family peptide modification chaperone n=1 Tax=Sphingomonas arenae TaxID=2812555 RepID=UPI001966FA10|nr:PqqD family peptide modification chaperone [Sphingomonas arenae]
MDDVRYRRNPEVLFGELGEDIVALSVARGLCYGMENVTAEVWSLLEQPKTRAELCFELMNRYEVDEKRCEKDVFVLLNEMQTEGLIERCPAA